MSTPRSTDTSSSSSSAQVSFTSFFTSLEYSIMLVYCLHTSFFRFLQRRSNISSSLRFFFLFLPCTLTNLSDYHFEDNEISKKTDLNYNRISKKTRFLENGLTGVTCSFSPPTHFFARSHLPEVLTTFNKNFLSN